MQPHITLLIEMCSIALQIQCFFHNRTTYILKFQSKKKILRTSTIHKRPKLDTGQQALTSILKSKSEKSFLSDQPFVSNETDPSSLVPYKKARLTSEHHIPGETVDDHNNNILQSELPLQIYHIEMFKVRKLYLHKLLKMRREYQLL